MFNWSHAYGELLFIVHASYSLSPSIYPALPSSTNSPVTASHSFAPDSSNHHHRQPRDKSCTQTVMIVVNRMLALPSATPGETPQIKTKACFIIRTISLGSLYEEFNLGEFQQIILSTTRMIRLFVSYFRPWMFRIPGRPHPSNWSC